MSTTREIAEIAAKEIVTRWKADVGKVVKYEQMESDIADALIAYGTERELAERERCAAIANEHDTDCIGCYTAREIAKAIREGKPPE